MEMQLSSASIAEDGGVTTVTASITGNRFAPFGWKVLLTPYPPATAAALSFSANRVLGFRRNTAGPSYGTVTLTAVQDDIATPDKVIYVHGIGADPPDGPNEGATGHVFSHAWVTLTIVDDDVAGVNVAPKLLSLTEGSSGDSTANYTVVLTSEPTQDVMLTVTTLTDGAPPASLTDWLHPVSLDKTSLTFTSADWNMPQTITVTARDDDNAVGETVTLSHTLTTDATEYSGLSASDVEVVITDDDTRDSVVGMEMQLSSASIAEDGGVTTVTASITGNRFAPFGWKVLLTPYPPATAAALSFSELRVLGFRRNTAGPSLGTVTLTAVQDDIDTPDKVIYVHGIGADPPDGPNEGATGHVFSHDWVTLTIVDDDVAGVNVAPKLLSLTEGSSGEDYTVVLTSEPTQDVMLTVTVTTLTDGTSPVSLDKTSLTFTSADWNMPQTITVTARDDDNAVGETVTLSHTLTTDATEYSGLSASDVEVVITNNDTRDSVVGMEMQLSSASIAEDGGVTTVTASITGSRFPAFGWKVLLTPDPPATAAALSFSELRVLGFRRNTAGPSYGTVTLTAVQDDIATPDKVIYVHGIGADPPNGNVNQGARGYVFSHDWVTLTIVDDDVAGVNVAPKLLSLTEGSSGDSTANYTVVLTSEPTQDVTVTVTVTTLTDGTSPVSLNTTSLTFTSADWNMPQTITVTARDDDNAVGETVTLSHTLTTDATEYSGLSASDVEVVITDDDTPGVMLAPTAINLTEGDMEDYTAVLKSEPTADVTLAVSVPDGATVSLNKTALTFTSTNWNMSQAVQVTALDDEYWRDTRLVRLGHTLTTDATEYSGLSASDVEVVITDDEEATMTLLPDPLTMDEDSNVDYTVVLNSKPTENVTVAVTVPDGAPVSLNRAMLTFTSTNWNVPQSLTLTASSDADAADHSVTLVHTLTGANYGYVEKSLLVTVEDSEEPLLILTPANLSIAEGSPNGTDYTAQLDAQPLTNVTVSVLDIHDHQAISNRNKISISPPSLTFTPASWSMPQTQTVYAISDSDGINETMTVKFQITGSEEYVAEPPPVLTVNVNDDDTPGVTLAPTQLGLSEQNTQPVTYQVVLDVKPTATVTFSVSGIVDDKGDPYPNVYTGKTSLTFTRDNWNVPQGVNVYNRADENTEDETVTLRHTVTGGGYDDVAVSDVTVRITDDDSNGVSVSPTQLTLYEGASPGASYTVALSRQPTADVTLTMTLPAGAPVSSSSTPLTFTTNNWNTPQTLTLTPLDDENGVSETVTLRHTVTGGGYDDVVVSNVNVRVKDDDTPALKVAPKRVTVIEGNASGAGYSVNLNTEPTESVTLTVRVPDGTPVSVTPTELTFTPKDWETNKILTVTAAWDADRVNEMVTLSHSVTGAEYDRLSVPDVQVSVTDKNQPPLPPELPDQFINLGEDLYVRFAEGSDVEGSELRLRSDSRR